MKKGKVAAAGMLSLAMLMGTPALNVLAAEPTAVVQPQGETLTRGEFFKMLDQAIDLPKVEEKRTYKDVPQGSELADIVNKLQTVGALRDSNDGTVRPESELKAGEAIALISGVLGIPDHPVPGGASPLDSKHWASNIAGWMKSAKVDYNWNDLDRTVTKQEAQALVKQLLSTSSDATKLLEESQKAQQNVKSFRLKGDTSFSMVLKQDALDQLSADERKTFDEMAKKGLSMKMEGSYVMPDSMYTKSHMKMPDFGQGESMGDMEIEQYIIGKDMYMKMPAFAPTDSENPSGWVKMKDAFPLDMKAMMEQQLSGIPPQLEKKLFYRSAGEGQLSFQGRIDKLSELASMMNGMQGMEDMTAALEEAEKSIGAIYIQGVMNLDPKTKLPVDSSMQFVISFNEKAGNAEEMPFKQMVMAQDVKYSDYNDNVKIELPEAAKQAKEVSAETATAKQASKQ
ncbi:hypothetical protein P9597_09730 [Aneurinibacillus migulanus]|uniref:DUF6612 family protein n=1 Tax=Aneurinibacillus migulanus TaxID=47500 RepID=UPI002E2315DE|nr:hypothetical protein [Aneurinibacillus migulanus]